MQQAVGIPEGSPASRHVAAYLANLMASVIPTLLSLRLLLKVLSRCYALDAGPAIALCATWALSSLAFPYSGGSLAIRARRPSSA